VSKGRQGLTKQKTRRVLIVEDDALIAMHLEELLTALGHEVVAQAARIDMALELACKADIDFAVLDINIAGMKSFPVADILHQRGVPFAFATGYGAEGLMDGYRDFPALQKPYGQEDLERTIAQAFHQEPR
jgi:CheY-like chemotaxis protein